VAEHSDSKSSDPPLCRSRYVTETAIGSVVVHRCALPAGHAESLQGFPVPCDHTTRIVSGWHTTWTTAQAESAENDAAIAALFEDLRVDRCHACFGPTPCHCWNDE
jgi:hypothetical protein